MAKLKLTISKPKLKGWPLVFIIGLALAVLAVVDRGSLALPCQVTVVARPGVTLLDDPVSTAKIARTETAGTELDAFQDVQDGFRMLTDGTWAPVKALADVPAARCG